MELSADRSLQGYFFHDVACLFPSKNDSSLHLQTPASPTPVAVLKERSKSWAGQLALLSDDGMPTPLLQGAGREGPWPAHLCVVFPGCLG